MSISLKADPGGTFGTVQVNGVDKLQVNADGSVELLDGSGKIVGYDDILGTVSESAGVPTGAIIESGSNANGEYVKYADGTMICTHTAASVNSGDTLWTYPSVFNAVPLFIGVTPQTTAGSRSGQIIGPLTGISCNYNVYNPADGRTTTSCRLSAIGRWF